MTDTNVTPLELAYMKTIRTNEYQDDPDGKSWCWSWSVALDFGQGRKASGVASSLCQKGLAEADGNAGDEACIRLTEKGAAALKKLES